MTALHRYQAYQAWVMDCLADHPGCTVQETRDGCAIWDDGGIVVEYDYEPDPYAEQKVRY